MDAFMSNLGLLINATLVATPPLLLAALGSCFSERSGVINLGIEGMMTIGAFVAAAVGLVAHNGWIAFLAGGIAGAIMAAIHAVVCIQYHADQTIAGTAMNFIGPGLALFLGKAIFGSPDTPPLAIADKLPKLFEGVFEAGSFLGNVLNVYVVAYLVFIFAAIAVFVFYKTKFDAAGGAMPLPYFFLDRN